MRTHHQTAEAYLAAWNADDEPKRLHLLNGWTEDARYEDPLMRAEGRDGIAAMIAGARSRFPGHRFALRGTPDGHGSFVRFSWTLAPGGGPPVACGTDVLRLDWEGRIAEVIGFLDGSAA